MPRTGCHGSQCCSIDRTFIYQFYLQTVIKKPSTPKKTYRNPIYLAREYMEEASIIAKGCNADEVAIIHVYEIYVPLISFSTEQMESIRRLTKEHQGERKKMLSEALKFFKGKNIKARTILKEGHPADTIIKVAHEEGFDMIVIGSRGMSGLQKLFLGSVSNAVIHEAKNCSVLIVK